jgi:hypothetical protein
MGGFQPTVGRKKSGGLKPTHPFQGQLNLLQTTGKSAILLEPTAGVLEYSGPVWNPRLRKAFFSAVFAGQQAQHNLKGVVETHPTKSYFL